MPESTGIDLSIIIPMYNAASYIAGTLLSVRNQVTHGLRYEIIVVDDGSTDRSCEVVVENSCDDIRLIRNSINGGTASARNVGLLASRGRWVQFLDSDDRLSENYLRSFEECMDPDAECFIASMIHEYHDHKLQRDVIRVKDKRGIGYFYSACTIICRRDLLLEFRHEFAFEDTVFVFEMMCRRDIRVKALPRAYYLYNCTRSLSKTSTFNRKEYRKMFSHVFRMVRNADELTKNFFLETFVGILFSGSVPLDVSIPIAIRTWIGYGRHLPAAIFNGVRGHVRSTRCPI